MGITNLYERATYSGAKAQNAEWGSSDYTGLADTAKAELCILQVSVSTTAAVVEITLDSGSTWTALNGGVTLATGKLYQFDIYITGGDTFNIRASNSSGTTVDTAKLVSDLDG
jgi:hypothetical protein